MLLTAMQLSGAICVVRRSMSLGHAPCPLQIESGARQRNTRRDCAQGVARGEEKEMDVVPETLQKSDVEEMTVYWW